MAVVPATDDPIAPIIATDDSPDMMGPHHDDSDGGSVRCGSISFPLDRTIESRAGIAPNLLTHLPSAPGARTRTVVEKSMGHRRTDKCGQYHTGAQRRAYATQYAHELSR